MYTRNQDKPSNIKTTWVPQMYNFMYIYICPELSGYIVIHYLQYIHAFTHIPTFAFDHTLYVHIGHNIFNNNIYIILYIKKYIYIYKVLYIYIILQTHCISWQMYYYMHPCPRFMFTRGLSFAFISQIGSTSISAWGFAFTTKRWDGLGWRTLGDGLGICIVYMNSDMYIYIYIHIIYNM